MKNPLKYAFQIYLICITIFLVNVYACTPLPTKVEIEKGAIEQIRQVPNSQYYVYKMQGCEYVGNTNLGPNSVFTHLGNCHNPIHHYDFPNP